MSSNKPENQPLLELDKNKAASPTESSGGNEVDSLEKVGNERNIAQLGKITLTAGVACLHMASTMGLITVGRKQDWGTGAKHTGGERKYEYAVSSGAATPLVLKAVMLLIPYLHLGLCRPYTRLNKVLIRDLDFDYAAFVSLLGCVPVSRPHHHHIII